LPVLPDILGIGLQILTESAPIVIINQVDTIISVVIAVFYLYSIVSIKPMGTIIIMILIAVTISAQILKPVVIDHVDTISIPIVIAVETASTIIITISIAVVIRQTVTISMILKSVVIDCGLVGLNDLLLRDQVSPILLNGNRIASSLIELQLTEVFMLDSAILLQLDKSRFVVIRRRLRLCKSGNATTEAYQKGHGGYGKTMCVFHDYLLS